MHQSAKPSPLQRKQISAIGPLIALVMAKASLGAATLVVGGGDTAAPNVKTFLPPAYATTGTFAAFNSTFVGGVRVASADFTGDGVPDIVAGAGTGAGQVRVFDGVTFTQLGGALAASVPFGPTYTGGVYVAAGDVNADGKPDIAVATGVSSNEVKVISGATGALLADLLPYGAGFTGGARVALGDINGDGKADLITVPGSGSVANVKAFSGADFSVLANFNAYDPSFTLGAFVAAGDVNGDGKADIVTGPDAGGASNVKVFDGSNPSNLLASFFAFTPSFVGGTRVAAGDVNADGRADLFAAQGPGGATLVSGFSGADLSLLTSFQPFDTIAVTGSFVAVGVPEPSAPLIGAAGTVFAARRRLRR